MTTILTGKSLPRRTLLKGIGASLALPLLDAMLPAFGLRGQAKIDRVTTHARQVRYVRRVVSHVRLKNSPSGRQTGNRHRTQGGKNDE